MRSAPSVDRMKAQCPRMRSGQARQPRAARRRETSGLTRTQPWTNPKNQALSGYSGATTFAATRPPYCSKISHAPIVVGTVIAERPRTDPYVRLSAYGSYLGCVTAKRKVG